MDALKKQRASTKGKFTRLENYLTGVVVPDREAFVARLEGLDTAWREYNAIHNNILSLDEVQATQEHEGDYADVETRYYDLKARLREGINVSSTNSAPVSMAKSDVKLPRIALPSFAGNILEWSSFHDLFVSLIHNNDTLSPSQKLHYLKNAIVGEASCLLQSIETTDANYADAWNLLRERYQNKRQLIQTYMTSMFGQKRLNVETPSGLHALIDNTVKYTRALHALDVPTDHWDQVLVFLVTEKLDNETRKQWELCTPSTDFPTFQTLKEFLEKRCRALEASNTAVKMKPSNPNQQGSNRAEYSNIKATTKSFYTSQSEKTFNCAYCKGSHSIYKCDQFSLLGEAERIDAVRKHSLCFNCLRSGHASKQCLSSSTCKRCGQKHHSFLHHERQNENKSALPQKTNGDGQYQAKQTHHIVSHITNPFPMQLVLLSTALVRVKDCYGNYQTCRALVDSGSQASFATEACVQRLGLPRTKADVSIIGIGQHGNGKSHNMVSLDLHSNVSDFACPVQALILDKITGQLPNHPMNLKDCEQFKNLQLADPGFHLPGRIELLLGADVFPEILTGGKITGPPGIPTALNTKLGWILSGRVQTTTNTVQVSLIHTDIQTQLRQFWELEEVKSTKQWLSPEERECEERFLSTTTRDETGRFIVRLPIKHHEGTRLGFSKKLAIKRLTHVEKRLEGMLVRREQYHSFLGDYVTQGHMERIPFEESKEILNVTNYLPHHFVTKEDSSTTSLRVVFDASAKTTSGSSLNNILMVGPKIQDDLWDILLRFRFHKYAFTADIQQMYRQVKITLPDSDLQRIVWRSDPSETFQEFRLTTVAYGTAAAPFLATRVLKQLALEDGDEFPEAREVLLRDFYIDDVMSGADDLASALLLQSELIDLLNHGGFKLRKWSANNKSLVEAVPDDLRCEQNILNFDKDNTIKTLGLYWQRVNDYFLFKVTVAADNKTWTKRSILSDISLIFDPLGWLAPVIIVAKIIIQKLWIAGVSWDEILPSQLETEWLTFRKGILDIEAIRVNRWVMGDLPGSSFQIHGFCDASEKAYAAVVYIRSCNQTGDYSSQLLCAKTKVAPVKRISLPRLELCGAVLLARLLKKVQLSLHLSAEALHAWTDSTVTLHWIYGYPHRWKTFVANRVSEIQETVPPEHWHHVSSKDNPADIASRGSSAINVRDSAVWWQGPNWLKLDEQHWELGNKTMYTTKDNNYKEEERIVLVGITPNGHNVIIQRFSNLTKMKRVIAYCLRFIANAKVSKQNRVVGPLNAIELHKALLTCVKLVQENEFLDTITALKAGKTLSSDIQGLNPFMDVNGFLRVGGRLRHATISYDNRFPIILPKEHHLTNLIIKDVHIRQLHSGNQATLATILRNYWIVNGRNVVRRVLYQCQRCFLDKRSTEEQMMGDLPAHRLEPIRPFLRSGVDFGGPFFIKTHKGRGGKISKSYVCLFVCFVTKAIHLELASDLSTETFLGALKRFIARRGKCTDIYSDNGTNFSGANNELKELKELFKQEQTNTKLADFLSGEGIVWHFSPARAPHFGGLWEAGIKSVKTHLRKILGDTKLTFEEFYTVLTQIEACLNSRPLSPLSSDPNDYSVLTPGHFLIGDSLTVFPEPNLLPIKENRLSRWQLTQKLTQQFWKRWRGEYLSTLQQRPKWKSKTTDIKVGDLVLLKDENVPPLHWLRGRVVQTHPGKDSLVRVVTVKTSKGLYKRPIVKLCPLPIN